MDYDTLVNELMVAEDCIAEQNAELSSLRDELQKTQETLKERESLIESLHYVNALLSWKDHTN